MQKSSHELIPPSCDDGFSEDFVGHSRLNLVSIYVAVMKKSDMERGITLRTTETYIVIIIHIHGMHIHDMHIGDIRPT